jgi:hypothetical protein
LNANTHDRLTSDGDLPGVHVRALFTHSVDGRLVCVNEPSRRPAPRFYLGCHAGGILTRFRHDLDEGVIRALEEACRDAVPDDNLELPPQATARIEDILARSAPIERRWSGPAYRFPERPFDPSDAIIITEANADLLRPHLTDWLDDVVESQPLVALVRGGHAVSLCCSGRRTAEAHEAAVETAAEFRGRGHAAQVVTRWAHAVADAGCIPLYSTSWENTASRAVAAKLGLICYASDMHFT